MLAFQGGNVEAVIGYLHEIEDAQASLRLREALVASLSDWQAQSIAPKTVLAMLPYLDEIGEGRLDGAKLCLQAHVALLGGEVRAQTLADVDGDQQEDLVVLEAGRGVRAYRMTADGNEEIALEPEASARYLMAFGDEAMGSDAALALDCYQDAWELEPGDETLSKLTSACRTLADAAEAEGDYAGALGYAARAMDVAQDRDSFEAYAQLELRYCRSMDDVDGGIRAWDGFGQEYTGQLQEYALEDWWRGEAGELRLDCARELALRRDVGCVVRLREAVDLGAPAGDALPEIIECFEPGESRAQLRALAIEVYALDDARAQEQRSLLAAEIQALMDSGEMEAQEALALLDIARQQGLSELLDIPKLYRDVAQRAVGEMSGAQYQDFDGDGREEFAGLKPDGELCVYAPEDGEFRLICSLTTDVARASLNLAGEARFLVVEAGDGSAFAVYRYARDELTRLAGASGISGYARDGDRISYNVALPGSVERFEHHAVELARAGVTDGVSAILWPQAGYPMPETAEAAALRCLEAAGYGLEDELALLTTQADAQYAALEPISALARPAMPLDAQCQPAWLGDDISVFEVRYGGNSVNLWTLRQDEVWKVAGFSKLEASGAAVDASLLCLNHETEGAFERKNETRLYRISLPFSAKLCLGYTAEAKLQASIYRENPDSGDAYISYALSRQTEFARAEPLFLDAGVYWLKLTAGGTSGGSYLLNVEAEPAPCAEREYNNTIAQANSIDVNRTYAASLQTSDDVDLFTFRLEQPGSVRMEIETEAGNSSRSRYALSLMDGGGHQALGHWEVAGDVARFVTDDTNLAAGTYLLRVEQGKEMSYGEYRLAVLTAQAQNVELEPNDSLEAATAISVNMTVTGASGVQGDVDNYSFSVPEDGLLAARLSFVPVKKEEVYRLSLSGEGGQFWSGSAKGSEGGVKSPKLALPAGDYMLEVRGVEWNSGEYQIQLDFEAGGIETESNDSLGDATPIGPNQSLRGSLLNVKPAQMGSDIDNYCFELAQPAKVRLRFGYDAPGDRASYFTLALTDTSANASTNALFVATVTGEQHDVASPNLYLRAGKYFVQVRGGKKSYSGAYQIAVESEAAGACEAERNDSAQAAAQIEVNVPVAGSFATESDVDCFTFTLPGDGLLQPALSFAPLESGSRAYSLTLSDGRNALMTVNFGGKESNKAVSPILLAAGSYYVQLECPAKVMQDYALSLNWEARDAVEREPNNGLADATPLEQGKPLFGVLLTENDVDLYHINIPADAFVTLRFSFDPMTESGTPFKLQLEQSGKTLWSKRVSGQEGGFEQPLWIPEGEYYLRIEPGKWTSRVYTLELDDAARA